MKRSNDKLVTDRAKTRPTALMVLVLALLAAGTLMLVGGPTGLGRVDAQASGLEPASLLGLAGEVPMTHSAFLPAIRSAIRSPRPIVLRFWATPGHIDHGASTTLSWQIDDAVDSLTLEPGVGDVTGRSSVTVMPAETTAYVLTARNSAGTTSARTLVTVGKPVISSFEAFPGLIYQNGQATLSWSILGRVDMLTLEPGIGDVTGKTQFTVSPTQDTVYTLTAVNPAGSDVAQVTVTVAPAPEIASFTADPAAIKEGGKTMLSWTISGTVESLVLEPGIGDVSGQSQVSLSPTKTTTYTLSASNGSGSDEATAVVRVSPKTELLVLDWNKPVVKSDSGFPREDPVNAEANGNWTLAPNFAQGTYQFRVEIRSQPIPKEMQVQYCVWQKISGEPEPRESCGDRASLTGNPGAKATWSEAVEDMWNKYTDVDYAVPRSWHGGVIRNKDGKPVSGKLGWDWNGEIPEEWYPLDWRFTVVVVAKGASFAGWGNYFEP